MENTYKHSEMVRIVEEFLGAHNYSIVTVLDSNDADYRDTISKDQFHMFKRDYKGFEFTSYYKLPSEIVVVLA